jgi:hypothetical protein
LWLKYFTLKYNIKIKIKYIMNELNSLMYLLDAVTKDLIKDLDCVSESRVDSNTPIIGTCPQVKRVTFNGDVTVVHFVDNTKIVVRRSSADNVDRQTAVVYAIVKRMFWNGKYDKNGNLETVGFCNWLNKIVKNGYDQKEAEATESERKRIRRAEHAARQKTEHDAAVERRIKLRAEELKIEEAARARLTTEAPAPSKKLMCENHQCKCGKKSDSLTKTEYVKPNKRFADFSQEEKRAYWREQNRRRKSR